MRASWTLGLALGAAALDGCGERAGSRAGGGATAAPPSSGSPVAGSASGSGGAPVDCAARVAAIARATSAAGACTTVVRLAYESHSLLGHQFLCGGLAVPTEATARRRAQADTGFGATATAFPPSSAGDAWVFWQAPTDLGGVGVVSSRTGASVFGGSIVWAGAGDVTYPKVWLPPAELGAACHPPAGERPPPARGLDLTSGSALPPSAIEAAIDVVWSTALPASLHAAGRPTSALVLLYPRSVGGLDPGQAEWIVLVSSGRAE